MEGGKGEEDENKRAYYKVEMHTCGGRGGREGGRARSDGKAHTYS
jgi:hypothetical protein